MDFSKLDKLISNLDLYGIPNGDLSVYYKHHEVYRKCFGFIDQAKTVPASTDDCYFQYSCSKVALATAAMQLIEQGKINLDDPVSKWFPEFDSILVKNGDKDPVPCRIKATVEHLLSMRGGLNYDIARPALHKLLLENPNADTQKIIHTFLQDPLEFQPGEHFLYSMCLDVMGAIIEQVSEERYSDYIKNHIAEPLGMKVCEFHVTSDILPHMPQQYLFDPNAQRKVGAQVLIPMGKTTNTLVLGPNYDSAGAGMITRCSDYVLLADALSNDGFGANGVQILTRASIDEMRKNRLTTQQLMDEHALAMWDYGYGYGLGVRTMVDNRIAESPKGEFGWDGLGGAFLLCDVENNIAINYVMSVPGMLPIKQGIHNRIRDLVYEALKDEIK